MSKKVVVTVPLHGITEGKRTITTEAIGFKGTACQEATRFMDRVGSQREETLKPEYYDVEQAQEYLREDGSAETG